MSQTPDPRDADEQALDRGGSAGRDLTAVPPEFRPACGRPGSHVVVRQVPVTIPHALCDLTGVILSYPGHGGAASGLMLTPSTSPSPCQAPAATPGPPVRCATDGVSCRV